MKKISIVLGVAFTLLLLVVACLAIFLYRLIWGGPPTITTNPSDYGKFEGFKGYSNLYIFPVDLPDSMQIDKYYYYYQDTFLDPTYQIYLEYSLSEADYQAEVQRLSSISEIANGEVHSVVYDTQSFDYPAYVTIMDNNLTYEYALLIEEQHKIVCVFTQFVYRKDIIFDSSLLPHNFQGAGDPNVNTLGGYNIYYFQSSFDPNGRFTDTKERKPQP